MSQLAAAVSEASTRLSVSAAEKDASAAALATRLRMSEERLAEAVSKEVRLSLSPQRHHELNAVLAAGGDVEPAAGVGTDTRPHRDAAPRYRAGASAPDLVQTASPMLAGGR